MRSPKQKRSLIAEIFVEMAVLAVFEFILVGFILGAALGQERLASAFLRGQTVTAYLAGELAQGPLSGERLSAMRARLRMQRHGPLADFAVLSVYVPGRGIVDLIGEDAELPADLEQGLRNAMLGGELPSLEETTLVELVTGVEEVWNAALVRRTAGEPPRGVVFASVIHGSVWSWIGERWFVVLYITVLVAALLGLGAYRVKTLVVEPVRELEGATYLVSRGERSFTLSEPRTREFAALGEHFAEMTTQLLEREEELRRRLVELEEAQQGLIRSEKMATVGRMAAGVAHEVGNPLSAVAGYLELLRNPKTTDAERADILGRASEEIERADRILRGLLDFARPRPPEPRRVDLKALIGKVLSMVASQKAFYNVEFVEDFESVPSAWADPRRVEQILINLFLNAADAMEGRGKIEIRIAGEPVTSQTLVDRVEPWEVAASTGDWVGAPAIAEGERAACIRVCDSGPGIAAEVREKVFEPFFSTKEPGKGTGLGLAISARLAAREGGVLRLAEAQSARTGGACFELWLPLAGSTGEEETAEEGTA